MLYDKNRIVAQHGQFNTRLDMQYVAEMIPLRSVVRLTPRDVAVSSGDVTQVYPSRLSLSMDDDSDKLQPSI